jgi:hypothetical protein
MRGNMKKITATQMILFIIITLIGCKEAGSEISNHLTNLMVYPQEQTPPQNPTQILYEEKAKNNSKRLLYIFNIK